MTDDYIKPNSWSKNDRVIRKLYTPREVVKMIRDFFELEVEICDLTHSERLLLMDSLNRLIWWFKDD